MNLQQGNIQHQTGNKNDRETTAKNSLILQPDDVTVSAKGHATEMEEAAEEFLSSAYLLFQETGILRDIPVSLRSLSEPLQRVTPALGKTLMPVSDIVWSKSPGKLTFVRIFWRPPVRWVILMKRAIRVVTVGGQKKSTLADFVFCAKAAGASITSGFQIKTLQHNNVQVFYGIAVSDENLCEYVVGERCQKGSVMSLIDNRKLTLDWEFKNALLKDTVAVRIILYARGGVAGTSATENFLKCNCAT